MRGWLAYGGIQHHPAEGVDTYNARARHLYDEKGFTTVLFEGKDEYGEYVKLMRCLYRHLLHEATYGIKEMFYQKNA